MSDERGRAPRRAGARSSSASAPTASIRSRTPSRASSRSPRSAPRTRTSPPARRPTRATASPAACTPAAARARWPSWTSSTARGRIQLQARVDVLGEERMARLLELDLGDIVGVDGTAFRSRRGELTCASRTSTLLAKALRPPPDKFHGLQRRRDALPPPRAGPDRQRGERASCSCTRARVDRRGARATSTRRASSRSRRRCCSRSTAARWRGPFTRTTTRWTATLYLRIATELYLKRLHRRRPGARLRARQGLPQRGRVVQAQPRVHDARVVRGLRGLRGRRRAASRSCVAARRAAVGYDGDARLHAAVAARDAARRDPRARRGSTCSPCATATRWPQAIGDRGCRSDGRLTWPQLVDDLLSKYVEPSSSSRRSSSTTRSSCRRSPRTTARKPGLVERFEAFARRHGDRQRLHRAQRPRRAARALRGAGAATPRRATRRPSRSTRPSSRRSSTGCRRPGASASGSTGW